MFRKPKTVDSIIASLGTAIDELDVLTVQQSQLAASEQEQAAALYAQAEARLIQRNRALRVRERLAALVE